MACLLREIRRVTSTLQTMLVCNTILLLSMILVCIVSLADKDPTMEVSYSLLCVGHVAWIFGVACRLLILATVVFRASPRRFCLFFSASSFVLLMDESFPGEMPAPKCSAASCLASRQESQSSTLYFGCPRLLTRPRGVPTTNSFIDLGFFSLAWLCLASLLGWGSCLAV